MKYVIFVSLLMAGCAAAPVVETRRAGVLSCIQELAEDQDTLLNKFEVCRQLYGLKKVRE